MSALTPFYITGYVEKKEPMMYNRLSLKKKDDMKTKEWKVGFCDILGKKFGKWLVLEKKPSLRTKKDNRSRGCSWLCQCECGTKKVVTQGNLAHGLSLSCGCVNRVSERIRGLTDVYNQFKQTCKRRKNVEFGLKKEEMDSIIHKNCHYCGDKPWHSRQIRSHNKFIRNFIYNGIDRVDSSKGYFFDNCVPCCYKCNTMKSNLNVDDFYSHIKKIALNRGLL